MPSVFHQRHAAHCRHEAAAQAKAQFWTDLDRRYIAYQANFKSPDLRRFCAIARQQCRCQQTNHFRISTYLTWLRAWSRQRAAVIGTSVECISITVFNHDTGFDYQNSRLHQT